MTDATQLLICKGGTASAGQAQEDARHSKTDRTRPKEERRGEVKPFCFPIGILARLEVGASAA